MFDANTVGAVVCGVHHKATDRASPMLAFHEYLNNLCCFFAANGGIVFVKYGGIFVVFAAFVLLVCFLPPGNMWNIA